MPVLKPGFYARLISTGGKINGGGKPDFSKWGKPHIDSIFFRNDFARLGPLLDKRVLGVLLTEPNKL